MGMTDLIAEQNFTSDELNQIVKVPVHPPLLTARFGCLKSKIYMTADMP